MKQSSFEQATNAGFFLLLLMLCWGPACWVEWHEPYAYPPLILFSTALGILAAGMLFECAGALTQPGKSLYTLAIFLSLPITAAAATGRMSFAATSILLISVGALYLVSRAEGDNRKYLLGMYYILLVAAGTIFGVHPAPFALIITLLLQPKEQIHWKQFAIAIVAVSVGFVIGDLLGVKPQPLNTHSSHVGMQTIALLPWFGWLLPIGLFSTFSASRKVAALISFTFMAIVLTTGIDSTLSALALAPLASVIAADYFLLLFRATEPLPARTVLTSALIAALTTIAAWWSAAATGNSSLLHGILLIFFLTASIILQARGYHRWSFPLWILSGLIVGSWSNWLPNTFVATRLTLVWFGGIILIALSALGIWFRTFYGRRPKFNFTGSSDAHEYGEGEFREYHQTNAWRGRSLAASQLPANNFRFTLFGDIAGADSVLNARQGGYFSFRQLVLILTQNPPDFCIALGDLSSSANPLPYRRVRQLLKKIPSPLLVTPGNHDIFNGNTQDTRLFRSLFGADHHSFICGKIHFLIVNNALGSFTDEQLIWIERECASHPTATKLCFCHKPLFDPRPGKSYAMEHRPHADRLHELFVQHQVTAVFSGHIHSCLTETRDGVFYIISGGGGSKIVEDGAPHHYLDCNVTSDSLTICAKSLERDSRVLFTKSFPLHS